MNVLSAIHQLTETQKTNHWRDEDNERRLIDNTRRLVDEKREQLSAVSHLSALVAGFSMVVLVELVIPEKTNVSVQIMYAVFTALSVCLNVSAMFSCVMMLVGVLKYDSVKRTQSFAMYWITHCEAEWKAAFMCFILGMPMFLLSLGVSAWIKFEAYQRNGDVWSYVAPVCVTTIAGATILFWVHERQKWGKFLQFLSTNSAMEIAHKVSHDDDVTHRLSSPTARGANDDDETKTRRRRFFANDESSTENAPTAAPSSPRGVELRI